MITIGSAEIASRSQVPNVLTFPGPASWLDSRDMVSLLSSDASVGGLEDPVGATVAAMRWQDLLNSAADVAC